jgi:rhamnosyl/mannosyltransferase
MGVTVENKKIKVTQVTRFAYPHIGGIEAVINQINDSLPNEEFEKEVLCCSNTDKSSVDNGVKYNRAKYLFEIFNNTISPSFLWKLSRVKTDILHYHMPFIFAVVCHFIARPKCKKMVITYHAELVGYDKVMKYFWWLYKHFYKVADLIHVLSPNVIDSDKILTPFREKCYVLPFGVNLDDEKILKTNNVREKYKDRKILLCSGRLVRFKGFQYAIDAMKNIDNAILLIMGEGKYRPILEEQIKTNNLEKKVILLGEIADKNLKNEFFDACDIFLLPSIQRTESFAIVQLEAMMHSKPVINTNLGTGVNFVSINKETGLTVEQRNSSQLANAVNELLSNDELRIQYGINARKRVEMLFDINKIKTKYRELYLQ